MSRTRPDGREAQSPIGVTQPTFTRPTSSASII